MANVTGGARRAMETKKQDEQPLTNEQQGEESRPRCKEMPRVKRKGKEISPSYGSGGRQRVGACVRGAVLISGGSSVCTRAGAVAASAMRGVLERKKEKEARERLNAEGGKRFAPLPPIYRRPEEIVRAGFAAHDLHN